MKICDIFLTFAPLIADTRLNRLNKAVLTSIHNQCYVQRKNQKSNQHLCNPYISL